MLAIRIYLALVLFSLWSMELLSETIEDKSSQEILNLFTDQEDIDQIDLELPKERDIIQGKYEKIAIIRIINKVTTKKTLLTIDVGTQINFNNLEIMVIACWRDPEATMPENKALLEIFANESNGKKVKLFHGWIFSSSPSISGLEHELYDVTVVECKTPKK